MQGSRLFESFFVKKCRIEFFNPRLFLNILLLLFAVTVYGILAFHFHIRTLFEATFGAIFLLHCNEVNTLFNNVHLQTDFPSLYIVTASNSSQIVTA